jgi:L-ascorbate metabolism protein UlaG (beta-lactamase superfamily)
MDEGHVPSTNSFEAAAEPLREDLRRLREAVHRLGEQIDRTFAQLGEEVERSAAETQALLKALGQPPID